MPRAYRKPLLSVKEVAPIFGVEEATIRIWLREGKLEGTRPGKNWRIKRTSVEALAQTKFGDDDE
jgi:excisionase family DNA binding protein